MRRRTGMAAQSEGWANVHDPAIGLIWHCPDALFQQPTHEVVAVGGPGGGGGGGSGGGGGGPPLHTAALWLGLPGVSTPHGTHAQAPPPKLSNSQQPFCAWVSQAPVHCASVQCWCSSALRCPGTVRLGAHTLRRVNSPQPTAERRTNPSAPSPERRSSAAAVTFAPIATMFVGGPAARAGAVHPLKLSVTA